MKRKVGLLQQPGIDPTSDIAVVKRHHHRALMLLARRMPKVQRIYVADYDGPSAATVWPRAQIPDRPDRDGVDPLITEEGHGAETGDVTPRASSA